MLACGKTRPPFWFLSCCPILPRVNHFRPVHTIETGVDSWTATGKGRKYTVDELQKRAAYLRGLADGMEITTKEGRLIKELVSIIDEMSELIIQAHFRIDEQEEYLEAVDEDLAEVELFLFDDDDDDDDYIEEIYVDED
jgi:hypothetical protein